MKNRLARILPALARHLALLATLFLPIGATAVTFAEGVDSAGLTWSPCAGYYQWTGIADNAGLNATLGATYIAGGYTGSACVQTTVSAPGTIRFSWATYTPYIDDYASFYVDNGLVAWIYGNTAGAIYPALATASYEVTGSGTKTLRWYFSKLATYSVAESASFGFLDNITFTPANDTMPDAFTFAAATDQPLSTWIESAPITAAGINQPAAISVTGGEYRIGASGAWTTAAGQVSNGQQVWLRVMSSAAYNTTASASLTIGTVSASFAATTIATPPTPDSTPDPFSRRVLYLPQNDATIAVFDAEAGTRLATIATDNRVIAQAVSPDGRTLFALNDGSNTLSLIALDSHRLAATWPLYAGANSLAVDRAGNRLYVGQHISTNGTTRSISGYDLASGAKTGDITSDVSGLAVNGDGSRLYATYAYGDRLSAIDPANPASPTPLAAGDSVDQLVASPDGSKLFIRKYQGMQIFDTVSQAFTNVALGTTPGCLAAGTVGGRLKVFATRPGTGKLLIYDVAANSQSELTVGTTPRGIALSPDNRRAYVVNIASKTVSVIDTENAVVLASWPAGEPSVLDGTKACAVLSLHAVSGFVPLADQAAGSEVVSNEVAVSGINTAATASVAGGAMSIDGGAWLAAGSSTPVANGQKIRLKLVVPQTADATAEATLTVGGQSAVFRASAAGSEGDTAPTAPAYTYHSSVALNTAVVSDEFPITLSDPARPVTVSIASSSGDAVMSINRGPWTKTTQRVAATGTIGLRLTTAPSEGVISSILLTTGSNRQNIIWHTKVGNTRVPTIEPNAFAFSPASVTATAPGAWVESSPITVAGIDIPTNIAIAGGEYQIVGKSGFQSHETYVKAGEQVIVRTLAPASAGQVARATLTVGSQQASFEVALAGNVITAPAAPTIGNATAGNGSATVSFLPPADNGGAAISGYTVTASPGNLTASGTASPITVTGLTNGTRYTFTVAATNSAGTGAPSASSNGVTPAAPISLNLDLAPGWNLAGNGVEGRIVVAASFNDAAKIRSVWKWLAGATPPRWAFYTPLLADGGQAYAAAAGYEFLTAIEAGEGYWINARQAFALSLPDAVPLRSQDFQPEAPHALPSGWSLVATGDNPTPADLNLGLASVPPAAGTTPANLVSLWAWDTTRQGWYFWAPSLARLGLLANYLATRGYLDFATLTPAGTIPPTTGLWLNKP